MTEADIAAVQAVVKKWRDAILAKDWDTFARLYTRDAVLMPPNGCRGSKRGARRGRPAARLGPPLSRQSRPAAAPRRPPARRRGGRGPA